MIPVTTYEGRAVAVFGLGRSGIAAALALMAGGARVTAWDDGQAARAKAEASGITLANPSSLDWSRQSALVLAPGVPLTHPKPHPVVDLARAAQCPIVGDIELFARARTTLPLHNVIAITGTNGKSTTTALAAHLVKACGGTAVACGNIGAAILDIDPLPREGVYVIEMSSYQIDLTWTLGPAIAVLLNITPDHLDRHGTMENYVAAKRRVFDGQEPGDVAIIGIDDRYGLETVELLEGTGRRVKPISVERPLAKGLYVENGKLFDPGTSNGSPVCDLSDIETLRGRHNWQNALAAYGALRELGYSAGDIAAGLKSFPGLAHRLERIATLRGVTYINDSKATNADAAARALESFEKVRWILGGRAKEGGIESLAPLMGRVEKAYLVGEAQEQFAHVFEAAGVAYDRCGTIERAVADAASDAGQGDVVLFSPACASFDQFPNFEVRGNHFRAAVEALRQERCA